MGIFFDTTVLIPGTVPTGPPPDVSTRPVGSEYGMAQDSKAGTWRHGIVKTADPGADCQRPK